MKDEININRACRHYLLNDKDFILNFFIFMLISLGFIFLLYKGIFDNRENDYIILMIYVIMLGISLIMSNSMIVNLTVKDKLNKRIEFILSSGIKIKKLIKSYTIEMWRLSSIVPFILFFLSYLIYDYKVDFKWVVGIFISMIIMTYFEILFFNITSLYQKNFKFFKNIFFFGTTVLIYMVGIFSSNILSMLEKYNLNIVYIILSINISLTLIFALISFRYLNNMNNESVINKEGTWA